MITLYAETNFVLSIGYAREAWESCDFFLKNAESGKLKLVVPAYSLVEGLASFDNTHRHRKRLSTEVKDAIVQLRRTAEFERLADEGASVIASLFAAKNEQDTKALAAVVARLLNHAEIEPLTPEVIALSRSYVSKGFDLSPQDAAVLASVWTHLNRGGTGDKWFVSADTGFDDPDIRAMLEEFNCEVLHKFDEAKERFEKTQ
jgi:hypothetical protein